MLCIIKSIHCFLSQPQHDIFTWKTSWLVSVVTKSKDLFARFMITELIIMLSPFLFECAHIHRPSQCSEAVLEQLSQITGSKINQTSMDVHHTESYSFQMNLSLSAASSFTAAQWVKLWRWICDWCTAAESHWVKVRPYLCSQPHMLSFCN